MDELCATMSIYSKYSGIFSRAFKLPELNFQKKLENKGCHNLNISNIRNMTENQVFVNRARIAKPSMQSME